MSTETDEPQTPSDEAVESKSPDSASDSTSETGKDAENVDVSSPEFQEMADKQQPNGKPTDLNRFQDIKVNVSADLGRAEVPIQTLMSIGEGSILELNRSIDSPVELVAQGVPLACGEVVVVNGCFAIRVTQVYENQKGQTQ